MAKILVICALILIAGILVCHGDILSDALNALKKEPTSAEKYRNVIAALKTRLHEVSTYSANQIITDIPHIQTLLKSLGSSRFRSLLEKEIQEQEFTKFTTKLVDALVNVDNIQHMLDLLPYLKKIYDDNYGIYALEDERAYKKLCQTTLDLVRLKDLAQDKTNLLKFLIRLIQRFHGLIRKRLTDTFELRFDVYLEAPRDCLISCRPIGHLDDIYFNRLRILKLVVVELTDENITSEFNLTSLETITLNYLSVRDDESGLSVLGMYKFMENKYASKGKVYKSPLHIAIESEKHPEWLE